MSFINKIKNSFDPISFSFSLCAGIISVISLVVAINYNNFQKNEIETNKHIILIGDFSSDRVALLKAYKDDYFLLSTTVYYPNEQDDINFENYIPENNINLISLAGYVNEVYDNNYKRININRYKKNEEVPIGIEIVYVYQGKKFSIYSLYTVACDLLVHENPNNLFIEKIFKQVIYQNDFSSLSELKKELDKKYEVYKNSINDLFQ